MTLLVGALLYQPHPWPLIRSLTFILCAIAALALLIVTIGGAAAGAATTTSIPTTGPWEGGRQFSALATPAPHETTFSVACAKWAHHMLSYDAPQGLAAMRGTRPEARPQHYER